MQQVYHGGESEVIFTIDTGAMKLTAIDCIAVEGEVIVYLYSDPETIFATYNYPVGTSRTDLVGEEQIDAYISGKGDVRVRHTIAWPSALNGLSKLNQ